MLALEERAQRRKEENQSSEFKIMEGTVLTFDAGLMDG